MEMETVRKGKRKKEKGKRKKRRIKAAGAHCYVGPQRSAGPQPLRICFPVETREAAFYRSY
jgi:hypothetical protein